MSNRNESRRSFLKKSAAGMVGASFVSAPILSTPVTALGKTGKPAILGGDKAFKGKWPTWPQGSEAAEDLLREVLYSRARSINSRSSRGVSSAGGWMVNVKQTPEADGQAHQGT